VLSRDLDEAAAAHLRTTLTGTLVTPDDPSYDETRALFNAMIDRRPAAIALCETEDDVAESIRCALDSGTPLAVRGGGHSVAGMSTVEGGLVIDLRRMREVVVDPEAGTARVGGGAVMSDLDRATQPYGLATTGGRVSTTGVGGFTLGGGSGWVDRKFGLACDNLLAADIVTAEGGTVHAGERHNPELFWALHGGGGNFGVATSLTLRLHPLPAVTVALLVWSPWAGPEAVRGYRDFMRAAPDEVGGGVIYLTGPPEPFVPEHLVGRLACAILLVYTGPLARGQEVLRPMLGLGHEGELLTELPYAELQCMFDDPAGYRNYWSAEHLDSLPDKAVDLFCARARDMVVPSPSQHVLFPQGGAIARAAEEFPLPWRRAAWVAHPFGMWDDPADDERGRRWAHDVRADLTPWSSGAVYLNFIGDEGDRRIVAGLGADNYKRLAGVKSEYDPDNVFRRNHNIQPG
jgi:FAD/FMN-containing dehydrogenase